MLSHGPESWHPHPDFFYQPGGGPLFDMGPYYLTALVSLLGPVARVSAATRASFSERLIGDGPRKGQTVPVGTSTHLAGTLDFVSGPIATVVMSFDVWKSHLPRIEIYGTAGTLSLPDPNTFGGPVQLFQPGMETWAEVPLSHPYSENSRGLGVADMAAAIATGRPHRASGELAYHVLDVMSAFDESSAADAHVMIGSRCERPAPADAGMVG
jgi:predicted dehydrogenase